MFMEVQTPAGEGETMTFWVGTSGFSYKEWKGSFYPEDLPNDQMLSYYGERLNAVEINNTFYENQVITMPYGLASGRSLF